MRAHYLQHVPFEGLGYLDTWLRAGGHLISSTRLFAGEPLPALEQFDWLIVMGGPMGANDDDQLPWMGAEKRLIAAAIAERKPVLGICLGAQLIAAVLGARVYKNTDREIGWFDIERVDATNHPLAQALPERAEVFHWHGDTFELPAGATLLASSRACRHQAFAYGADVLALQFHLETMCDSAAALIENSRHELTPDPYVQTAEEMTADPLRFERLNRLLDRLLDAFLGAAASR